MIMVNFGKHVGAAMKMMNPGKGVGVASMKENGRNAQVRRETTVRRAAGACVLAMVVGMALAAPGGALVTRQALADEEDESITRTFTWMEGEPQAEVPPTIEIDGVMYKLTDAGAVSPDAGYQPEVRTITREYTGVYATLEEAEAAMPADREVSEGGFAGDLTRETLQAEPLYEGETRTLDREVAYGPYSTNDLQDIPATIQATVTDAQGSRTVALQAADSHWEAAQVNAAGMPVGYTLVVTYRAGVDYQQIVGYNVKARYTGEVTSTAVRLVRSATYVPVVQERAGLPSGVIAGGAATAAAALAGGMLVFFRTRNATICRRGDERVLARVHARRDAQGTLRVPIPARISLAAGAVVLLRPQLCDGGPCEIWQAGHLLLRTTAVQRVDVAGSFAREEVPVDSLQCVAADMIESVVPGLA